MKKALFSTKAQTLLFLKDQLRSSRILPLEIIKAAEWRSDPDHCLRRVEKKLGRIPFIVRSSSVAEDLMHNSNAGAFKTVQLVSFETLSDAIDEVIASYGALDPDDEVLIQPMLNDVISSGVAFSHDPSTASPYRTINISSGSNTAQVTSGIGGELFQIAAESAVTVRPMIRAVLSMVEELVVIFEDEPLDCEFAFTIDNGVEILWLLQVRQLVLRSKAEPVGKQTARLDDLEKRLKVLMKPHPLCLGKTTIYGVMPDWNPAEIIGLRPGALALSLYKDLITDSIWAFQRNNYGYRNLRSFPLMVDFCGTPYIDTRVSFNSFIPADLGEQLAENLVDYYLDALRLEPSLHDKIEFEIVFACHTFDIRERIQKLRNAKFSENDCLTIVASLKRLTEKIIDAKSGYWLADAAKVQQLKTRRERILNSSLDPATRVYWLLEDAKRFGSLPFAGLARAAFIAVANLNSLVVLDIFSKQDVQDFMLGLTTVSKSLSNDRNKLTKAEFLDIYGHLRPGTYDILTKRYDEDPEFYFDWDNPANADKQKTNFLIDSAQFKKIAKLQETYGFNSNPFELINFFKSSIELRESAKFEFTHNVSDALQGLVELGEMHGFSRSEMAFCDIHVIRQILTTSENPKKIIERSVRNGEERSQSNVRISLPPLIANPQDVWSFESPSNKPNFVTQRQVIGKVTAQLRRAELAEKIVLIPNADPGYDWIFSCGIIGLITAWGGANSHMAIRSSEIGLPAAIGVGERLYGTYARSNRLNLDCAGQRIIVVE